MVGLKRAAELFLAFVIVSGSTPVQAAFENPGVPVATVPVATEFFMPFGDMSADISSTLHPGNFNGFSTTIFDESFLHIKVEQNGACGNELSTESPGWYVFTPHKNDKVYDGSLYSTNGSFHPGEDWNGRLGGFDDLCQRVFPIAEGIILANGFDIGFGYMMFVLHRTPGGDFLFRSLGIFSSYLRYQ